MNSEKKKVLLIMEQCNPEWASVPLLAYNFYREIRKRAHVTLVSHERNRQALEKIRGGHEIAYIHEPEWLKKYYGVVSKITSRGGVNWPLQHALSYPVYAAFNTAVHEKYGSLVARGDYDIVHSMTPVLPRYPVKIAEECRNTPFVLGPVNGGVPFPKGFGGVARKEFAQFNFLRMFTKLIPGYAKTYRRADKILSGSTYTLEMIKDLFSLKKGQLELFHENGIPGEFIKKTPKVAGEMLNLLFVGRLVAYKGADMAIDALASLPQAVKKRVTLTIVGGGPERDLLEKRAESLGVGNRIQFTGWVDQKQTLAYYRQGDLFCFPSIREFGGAVALEAMACGLPCIVPDYAGLGEYVTEQTGFKIPPLSREYLVNAIAEKITFLLENPGLRQQMSEQAIKRARGYEWGTKADRMIEVYEQLIPDNKRRYG